MNDDINFVLEVIENEIGALETLSNPDIYVISCLKHLKQVIINAVETRDAADRKLYERLKRKFEGE